MTYPQKAIKNTILRSLGQIINMLLSSFFILYITRKLGSSDFGKYAFAFSLTSILVIISELGTNTILTREISRKTPNASLVFGNVIALRGFLTFFYFLSLFAIVFLLSYPIEIILICIIMGGMVLATSFLDLINSIFRGWEKMEYEAVTMVLNRILVVTSGVLILYYNGGLFSFIIAIFLANSLFIYPIMQLCFRKFLRPQINVDIKLIKFILKESFPVGIMFLLLMLMTKSGLVFLSYFKDYSAVGWYGAPLRLMESMMVFPLIFSVALLPSLTNLGNFDVQRLNNLCANTLKGLIVLGLPITLWLSFFSAEIVKILFGNDFEPSSIVLPFLVFGFFFYSLNIFMSHFLIAINKQAANLNNYFFSAMVTIAVSLLMIPKFSYFGVGCSFLLGQIFLFLLSIILIARLHFRIDILILLKPVLGVGSMAIIFFIAGKNHIWPATLISFGSYLLIIILSGAINKEDVAFIRNVWLPR